MKEIISKTKIKVPFYDVDPMNVVWHGNYVKYLEIARAELFDKFYYNYKEMHADNVAFPIAKIDLKYIKSAHLGDDLIVECILEEFEPAILIKYKIFVNGERILSANTMQIGVNIKTGETLYSVPEALKKGIENYEK